MKKILYALLLAALPFAIYFFFVYIFDGDHGWMIPLVSSSMLIVAVVLFRKSKKEDHLLLSLSFIVPLWIAMFISSLFADAGFIRSYSYLILLPLSVILAWLYHRRKWLVIPVFSIVLFFLVGFIVMPNVFEWQRNTGARVNKDFLGIELMDKNQTPVQLDSSKITVLDFWTTSCGICFQKFPDLEKYYLEFQSNPEVEFYSINIPLERDQFEKVVNLVDTLDYKFPTLYSTSMAEATNLGIQAYPHLLILKDGKLRYDGRLIVEPVVFVNHLKDEVNRLLEE
jgi:thiol-disulfide isomerase/thioredoxin